jgi:hypothetical protein
MSDPKQIIDETPPVAKEPAISLSQLVATAAVLVRQRPDGDEEAAYADAARGALALIEACDRELALRSAPLLPKEEEGARIPFKVAIKTIIGDDGVDAADRIHEHLVETSQWALQEFLYLLDDDDESSAAMEHQKERTRVGDLFKKLREEGLPPSQVKRLTSIFAEKKRKQISEMRGKHGRKGGLASAQSKKTRSRKKKP